MNFFNETFDEKIKTPMFQSVMATDEAVKVAKANQFIDSIEKHIAPLLEDAAPFFGGSKEFTLVEVRYPPSTLGRARRELPLTETGQRCPIRNSLIHLLGFRGGRAPDICQGEDEFDPELQGVG